MNQKSTVICAWCNKVMKEGDNSCPPSHGICDSCLAKATAELEKS